MAQNFATKQLRLSGKLLTTDSAAELYVDGNRLLKANESGLFSPSGAFSASNPYVVPMETETGLYSRVALTGELFFDSGNLKLSIMLGSGNAYTLDLPFSPVSGFPIGPQTTERALLGYGTNFVTNKILANCRIGDNDVEEPGAIKYLAGELSIYSETYGEYVPVTIRFAPRQTGDGAYVLEHLPQGYATYLDTRAFDSTSDLDPNGYPIIQDGLASMGAYSPIPRLGGYVV